MIIIAVSIIKPAPDVPLSHFSTKGNSKLSKVIATEHTHKKNLSDILQKKKKYCDIAHCCFVNETKILIGALSLQFPWFGGGFPIGLSLRAGP